MSTFNKADVLRVLKDRQAKLEKRKSATLREKYGQYGFRVEKSPDVKAAMVSMNMTWKNVLGGVIKKGMVVHGLKVKNANKLVGELAKEIAARSGGHQSTEICSAWDYTKAPEYVAAAKRYEAAYKVDTAKFDRALAALEDLCEKVSLAGVPADIVKKLEAIDAMLK